MVLVRNCNGVHLVLDSLLPLLWRHFRVGTKKRPSRPDRRWFSSNFAFESNHIYLDSAAEYFDRIRDYLLCTCSSEYRHRRFGVCVFNSFDYHRWVDFRDTGGLIFRFPEWFPGNSRFFRFFVEASSSKRIQLHQKHSSSIIIAQARKFGYLEHQQRVRWALLTKQVRARLASAK